MYILRCRTELVSVWFTVHKNPRSQPLSMNVMERREYWQLSKDKEQPNTPNKTYSL